MHIMKDMRGIPKTTKTRRGSTILPVVLSIYDRTIHEAVGLLAPRSASHENIFDGQFLVPLPTQHAMTTKV